MMLAPLISARWYKHPRWTRFHQAVLFSSICYKSEWLFFSYLLVVEDAKKHSVQSFFSVCTSVEVPNSLIPHQKLELNTAGRSEQPESPCCLRSDVISQTTGCF